MLLGRPFPSLAHLLVPPHLLSTSQPSYLSKSVVLIAHPEVTVILCALWLGHGAWHVARHYRGFHKGAMRLVPEQSRETFLEQKVTVQI